LCILPIHTLHYYEEYEYAISGVTQIAWQP
jgi:hypothetical protein